MFSYEFERPSVTVDVVALNIKDSQLRVLLVTRLSAPFKGQFALPGGYVGIEESLEVAATRVLRTKASLNDVHLEQLATFGEPSRDPRGRTISVSYLAIVPAHSTYSRLGIWQPIASLGALAFDHEHIVQSAIQRVRSKLSYSSLALKFLPDVFTLTTVQRTYEAVLGKEVDKRNFRKSFLSRDIVKATGAKSSGGAHPPAALYESTISDIKYW